MTSWHRREDGSASLEGTLGVVIILLGLAVVTVVGRYTSVNNAIDNATYAGARAASISRSAGQARSDAEAAVSSALNHSRVYCASRSVDIDTSAFATDPGTASTITVGVTCNVSTAGIAGVPAGTLVFTSRHSSSLDTYREHS